MKLKRTYNRGSALSAKAKTDYEVVIALITEHNRLKNAIENAIRDVRMWGTRLTTLKGQEGTRPYEVAEEKFASSKAAYAALEFSGEHFEDLRLVAAKQLFTALHRIAAGEFVWVDLEQSRQRKIKAFGIKRYRLSGESVVHRREALNLRKKAIKALELGDGTKAVQLMKRSQAEAKEHAEYAPILQTIDKRVLALQAPPALYVEALSVWVSTLLPQEAEIMKRTELDPLIAEDAAALDAPVGPVGPAPE